MNKKLSVIMLSALLVANMAGWSQNRANAGYRNVQDGTWTTYVASAPSGYSASENKVTIESAEELAWFAKQVNQGNAFEGSTIELAANLDMSAHAWVAIGTQAHPFKGTFDGKGFTISGLENVIVNNSSVGTPGLFGTVDGGTIQNVFITSSVFVNTTTSGYIGILADTIKGGAIVHSCEVMGEISTINANVIAGGLVGLVDAGSELHSCMSLAEVNGTHIGGLAGQVNGSVNNCIAYPDFYYADFGSGTNYAAGLVGVSSGSVENSYIRFKAHSDWYVPSVGQMRMLFGMETIFRLPGSTPLNWQSTTVHEDTQYLTSSLMDANTVFVVDCRVHLSNGGAGNIGTASINDAFHVRLVGNYKGSGYQLGDVINVDGRYGVVFHVNDDDTGGWVAALSDLKIDETSLIKLSTSTAAASMSSYYNTDDWGDPVYIDNLEHDFAFGNNGKLFCETMENAESASADNVIGKMKTENWPIKQFEYTAGGILNECYYQTSTSDYALVNSGTPQNCGQYTSTTVPYAYGVIGCMVSSNRMMDLMNKWVNTKGASKYALWAQPITKGINEDYPVLKLKDFNTMANDGTTPYLYYGDLDAQLANYTGATQTVFFYGSKASSTANNLSSDASLYIDQDAALGSGASLKGYTSRLLEKPSESWHLYASPLQDSKIGILYGGYHEYDESQNPCNISLIVPSIFPNNTPVSAFDLYTFYEKEYHWINLKRQSDSHWHMNSNHANIAYSANDNLANNGGANNSVLVQGKGYLTALAQKSYLQSNGQFSDGSVTIPVTAEAGSMNSGQGIPATEGTELKGYNLIGNPYQSYLDFDVFASKNSSLWAEGSKFANSYATFDAAENTYVSYLANPSVGSKAATGKISMHQGFFIIKTGSATTASFDNTMRSTEADGASFRSERPAFPLVNLKATGSNGAGDIAVVEFGRPEFAGAAKMKNIGSDGKVYFSHNGEEYAILYLDSEVNQMPVCFETSASGSYTMTWSTANATFDYLHLIDNMTGADVDMLSNAGYSFTASADDYKSRFKLMFAYTGVEENEDASASSSSFAFMHDGAIIVNGEGVLEVIDVNGRTIISSKLTDVQNTISLPQVAQGIYMLKLVDGNNVKVQKMVID